MCLPLLLVGDDGGCVVTASSRAMLVASVLACPVPSDRLSLSLYSVSVEAGQDQEVGKLNR